MQMPKPALLVALLGKGKGTGPAKAGPAPESESSDTEYRKLFEDAAKDGDWGAAFDAVMACCKDMESSEAGDDSETEVETED